MLDVFSGGTLQGHRLGESNSELCEKKWESLFKTHSRTERGVGDFEECVELFSDLKKQP